MCAKEEKITVLYTAFDSAGSMFNESTQKKVSTGKDHSMSNAL